MQYEYQEKSIEEHPAFRTPRNNWRVLASHIDDETGELVAEDRSGWRPEEDGKCLANFWDFDRKRMRDDSPMPGVSTFFVLVQKP